MTDMPPLGPAHRVGATTKITATVFAVAAVTAGVVMGMRRPPRMVTPVVQPMPLPAPSPPPREKSPLETAGLRRTHVTIEGPLETALVAQLGRPLGQALVQVVLRELVWWVDIPGDFRKGDSLDVLWQDRHGEEPLVQAVRFKSNKLARTFRAFRYKASDSKWARFYQADGDELELRLENGPLDDYEQITSLLRDGRGHKGVDFKTPVGTDVKAPFDAVVTRKNWNTGKNGNSLEIKESIEGDATPDPKASAKIAAFLHLSEVAADIRVGDHIKRGQVVAQSGNTGHSFAPHLHYQLMTATRPVVDPFAAHHVSRRHLPTVDKSSFDSEARRLEMLLDTKPAGS